MYVVSFRDASKLHSVKVSEHRTAVSIFDTLCSDRSVMSAVVVDDINNVIRYFLCGR